MKSNSRSMAWPVSFTPIIKRPPLAILAIAIGAFAVRLFYWRYTGRIWDDALISTVHSENFWQGLGLTHVRPMEAPKHTFTSPLSVLIPLLADGWRLGAGLGLMKLVSAACGALTVLIAWALAKHPRLALSDASAYVLAAFLAFEHHQILWGMAGMETQVAVLVLLLSYYYLVEGRTIALGAALALCLLARPDFAFWVLIAGLFLVTERHIRRAVQTAAVSAALYAPWLFFTWVYYGSPIPQTIIAKSLGMRSTWAANTPLTLLDLPSRAFDILHLNVYAPLGPSYGGHGTGFAPFADNYLLSLFALLFAVYGAVAVIRRRERALYPALLFFVTYSMYYVVLVPVHFGWYMEPPCAVALLLALYGLEQFCKAAFPSLRTPVLYALSALYVCSFVFVLPITFNTDRLVQQQIESVRQSLGTFLGSEMTPDQWVGAECLGYLYYYSRRPVMDWPGLGNNRALNFSKSHPDSRSMYHFFEYERPEYLALRKMEYEVFSARSNPSFLQTDYCVIRSFAADPSAIKSIRWIDWNIDRSFVVLKRRDVHSGSPCRDG